MNMNRIDVMIDVIAREVADRTNFSSWIKLRNESTSVLRKENAENTRK